MTNWRQYRSNGLWNVTVRHLGLLDFATNAQLNTSLDRRLAEPAKVAMWNQQCQSGVLWAGRFVADRTYGVRYLLVAIRCVSAAGAELAWRFVWGLLGTSVEKSLNLVKIRQKYRALHRKAWVDFAGVLINPRSPTRKETSYSDRRSWCSCILFIIIIGGILLLYI